MEHDIEETVNGFIISVKNITKGNDEYSEAEGYTDGYIADIIEEGKGYGYDLDSVIGARPFTEISQNVIDYTDRIDKIVENELRKKGY